MKNKEYAVFVVLIVIIFGFVIPFASQDKEKKAATPKLDRQYVKVYYGGIAISMTEELALSDEDAGKLMDYINYGGRDWTKTETGEYAEKLSRMYVVQISPDQLFWIPAAANEDGSLDILFITTPSEGETDKEEAVYSTLVKANAASPLLALLEKYKP